MKTYIGISRDHSASMGGVVNEAKNDFNKTINSIREASGDLDTVVSVIKNGVGLNSTCEWETRNSSVTALKPMNSYIADGYGTPLFDSVGMLIEHFESMPDANDLSVSFMVMVVTDGQENRSRSWTAKSLAEKISELQATDRWTFAFRVPKDRNGEYRRNIINQLNLFEGNVQEWDVSSKGLQTSTEATQSSFKGYFTARSTGLTSTNKFFVDLGDVKPSQVKECLDDITSKVTIIRSKNGGQIRDVVNNETTFQFEKGIAFYELLKTEKVQDYKRIVIKHRKSGKAYGGDAARQLLGIPIYRDAKVAPSDTGKYDIYIQSNSVNRKILPKGRVLIWK